MHQGLCLDYHTGISFILSNYMPDGYFVLQMNILRLRDDIAIECQMTWLLSVGREFPLGLPHFLFILQAEMLTAFVLSFVRMLTW